MGSDAYDAVLCGFDLLWIVLTWHQQHVEFFRIKWLSSAGIDVIKMTISFPWSDEEYDDVNLLNAGFECFTSRRCGPREKALAAAQHRHCAAAHQHA